MKNSFMSLIEKIFETNVINLTFVIVILISVVGNALTQSLSNRRETILMNLSEADKKANEAQEKLRLAKVDFEVAKDKASQLKKQNQEQADNEKKKLLSLTDNEIINLKKKKQEVLELAYSQQKKVLISKLSTNALRLVKERCRFQTKNALQIVDYYLNVWTES